MRSSTAGVIAGLLIGCQPSVLPPDVGGEPLWQPFSVAGADDQGGPTGPVDDAARVEPGPITLRDVSAEAGLAGVAAGGNTHGVGVGFVDIDGDGAPDIILVNGLGNLTGQSFGSRLLRNRGDGTFEDRTAVSGLGAALAGRDGYSIAAGDIDGDGDTDLYVGAQPSDRLLINDGQGNFEDRTAIASAGGPPSNPDLVANGKSKVVSIVDYDNDGRLDLFSASSTLPMPGAYLLRNRGDGTFEDVTLESGIKIHASGNPCAVLWSDYDNDADRDVWIWNDRGGKVLLRNEGDSTFTDVTDRSGAEGVQIGNPMGIGAADIDRDGDLDYYVSNIGNNPLLRNSGDGTFIDITGQAGTGGQFGWGLGFEDFDLDGRPDIFVAQEDNRPELIFHNRGGSPPRFDRIEVPHDAVLDDMAAHNVAVAFADYDLDGRVDVVTARTDGSRLTLYRNETDTGTHGWLAVRLPAGEVPAVGGRIAVGIEDADAPGGEAILFRDITGGSSRASQNDLTVRFGLGQLQGARWVGALLPTGEQAIQLNVGAGNVVELAPR